MKPSLKVSKVLFWSPNKNYNKVAIKLQFGTEINTTMMGVDV